MSVIRTERGLDRLVNFSDATVAIAITLLILPLVDASSDVGHQTVAEFVDHHFGALIGFAISFVVIARFWIIHHRLFEWVQDYSVPMIWANFLWLVSIVFIPFATNLLAESDSGRGDVDAVYIGNMIIASLATLAIEVTLKRNPELLREDARNNIDLLHGISAPILLIAALVLAVLFPHIGMWWVLLLFLSRPLDALLTLLFRRGSQGTA